METKVVISHCLCGKKGTAYKREYQNSSPGFFVRCECGRKTSEYTQLETAINEWNKLNIPKKVKVQYRCGYCGAEVFLGFAECPKCKTQIEW